MSSLQRLAVDSSGNLNYANVFVDTTSPQDNLLRELGLEADYSMMSREEVKIALSCAMNIKKHLTRALQKSDSPQLQEKLEFVNGLIREVGLKAS